MLPRRARIYSEILHEQLWVVTHRGPVLSFLAGEYLPSDTAAEGVLTRLPSPGLYTPFFLSLNQDSLGRTQFLKA